MKMNKWNDRFLEMAYQVSTWSKDTSCKVGCVIADSENKVVSCGYNGFPKFLEDKESVLNDKELKNTLTEHAEHNAIEIMNAVYKSFTPPFKMYITHVTCFKCALETILSKCDYIEEIYFEHTGSPTFLERYQIERAINELLKHKFKIYQYRKKDNEWHHISGYSQIQNSRKGTSNSHSSETT